MSILIGYIAEPTHFLGLRSILVTLVKAIADHWFTIQAFRIIVIFVNRVLVNLLLVFNSKVASVSGYDTNFIVVFILR